MNEQRTFLRYFPVLCAVLLMLSLVFAGCASPDSRDLITDYNALVAAIRDARHGDVLLVGDIDFSPTSPDLPNSYMNIELDKSLTIKSAKGKAVFTNSSFLLKGSKVSDSELQCRFEDIIFDGGTDTQSLVGVDFDYPWSEATQSNTWNAPMKAQQAFAFSGNVDAGFQGCSFRNYMHEYGPVIDIRYGDYTDNAYLLDLFGDYSGCTIDLLFKDCHIENNAAFYDGGAIYIEGNKNVNLRAENCVFSGNQSGCGEFRRGGGVIYASGATLNFYQCRLENNQANHVYVGTPLPENDTNKGGALLLEGSELTLIDCTVKDNRASVGGALSFTNSMGDLDGCVFTKNRAEAFATNPYEVYGPWSNMALGGAIYVEGNNGTTVALTNCEIRDNSAATAYGGIYGFYTPSVDPSTGTYYMKMSLCTYEGNTSDTSYDYSQEEIYPWASHPGDSFANPHLSLLGCYITDDSFIKDFPRNETPHEENGYNYLAAPGTEAEAGEMRIPAEATEKLLAGRYGEKLKNIHVGSNYSPSLYRDSPITPELILSLGGAVLLLVVVVVLLFLWRRKKVTVPEEAPAPEKPLIVMTRYTPEQIESVITRIPETQLLTSRELEVLKELLSGKKQSEVARELGIEVSTVKDFYRKIYDKLNVPNKDGLLCKASEVINQ